VTGTVFHEDFSVADDASLLEALSRSLTNLTSFHGDFAGVYLSRERAVLFSDRMCSRKLYYTVVKDTLCLATRMDVLAEKTRQFDLRLEAAGTLLYEAALVTPISWYEDAHSLDIGETVSFDFNTCQLEHSRYDMYFMHDRSSGLALEENAAALADALENSVLDICNNIGPENLMMTLTAGFDSRLIATILKNHRISIPAYVVEIDQGYDEIALTQRINEFFRLPLHGIPQQNDYFKSSVEKCVSSMEYTMCEHVWYAEALNYASSQNRVCMTGLIVSNLLHDHSAIGGEFSSLFGEGTTEERIQRYCGEKKTHYEYIASDFQQALYDAYEQEIEEKMLRYMHIEGGILDWYINARASRQILRLLDMSRPHFHSVQPICANTVLSLALSVPVSQLGDEFYRAMYQRLDPEAWLLPSSRCTDDRKSVRAIPISYCNADVLKFLAEPIRDGLLAQERIVDVDALDAYLDREAAKPDIWPTQMMRLYVYEHRLRETERLKREARPLSRLLNVF